MQELDALFSEFDKDGNGQLDRTEMEALVSHIFDESDVHEADELCEPYVPTVLYAAFSESILGLCIREGGGWPGLVAAVFELADVDGDGSLSRQEFERVATMLSPSLGAALSFGSIGGSTCVDNSVAGPRTDAFMGDSSHQRGSTMEFRQTRLSQLFELYASDGHRQLEMPRLVVLIETIHSAERALTANSLDDIRGGGSIAAFGSGGPSKALAEREAKLVGQFICKYRRRGNRTQDDDQKLTTEVDAQSNGQSTSNLVALYSSAAVVKMCFCLT